MQPPLLPFAEQIRGQQNECRWLQRAENQLWKEDGFVLDFLPCSTEQLSSKLGAALTAA